MTAPDIAFEICDQPHCWCRQDRDEPPARVMRWNPAVGEPLTFPADAEAS